jgi:hypothetical protein
MKMSKTPLTPRGRSLVPTILMDMAAKSNLTAEESRMLWRLIPKLFPADRVQKWIQEEEKRERLDHET